MTTADELLALEGELRGIDDLAADRLAELRRALDPSTDAGGWLNVDPAGVIDVNRVADVATSIDERGKRAAWLELVRNVVILVPIVLTWLSLAYAATGYQAAVASDPNLVTTPFLLLWERGFGDYLPPPWGSLGFLSLGVVAAIDVALICVVIGLTWVIQHEVSVRQHARDEAALGLGLRLSHALGGARLEMATRATEPALIGAFMKAANGLVSELRAERNHVVKLGDDRERHYADLSAVTRDLRVGGEALAATVSAYSGSLENSERVQSALTVAAIAVAESQGRLTTAIDANASELRHEHELLLSNSSQLSVVTETILMSLEQTLPAIAKLSESANSTHQALTSMTASVAEQAQNRTQIDEGLNTATSAILVTLGDVRETLAQQHASLATFASFVEANATMTESLREMARTHRDSGSSFSNAAAQLEAAMVAQRDAATKLAISGDRLESAISKAEASDSGFLGRLRGQ